MDKYNVTGMTCSACSSRVEKAVSKVPGVDMCQVNLLTNSMNVEGTATGESIIQAVEEAHILSDPSDTSYVCVYGTCNVGLASAVIF